MHFTLHLVQYRHEVVLTSSSDPNFAITVVFQEGQGALVNVMVGYKFTQQGVTGEYFGALIFGLLVCVVCFFSFLSCFASTHIVCSHLLGVFVTLVHKKPEYL